MVINKMEYYALFLIKEFKYRGIYSKKNKIVEAESLSN